jgi:hypothetical protein
MTILQEIALRVGRRASKFTPANIQKIKDWVAEGISRDEIAKSLGVTVGSLQVTCSRMGIRLRNPKMRVQSRPYIPNHPPMVGRIGLKPQHPQFRIVVKGRYAIDVSLTGPGIARLALEAAVQNLGMTQLLTQAVTTAIRKDLIEDIFRESEPAPAGAPPNAAKAGPG